MSRTDWQEQARAILEPIDDVHVALRTNFQNALREAFVAGCEHERTTGELAQLRAWKESVLDVAARRIALDMPPPMHIHKSHGRMPDDDVRQEMFVPIESYNEAKGQANLSFVAVEAMHLEVKAIKEWSNRRIEQLEEALRFYANPDNDDDGGKCAFDALMGQIDSPLRGALVEIARNAKNLLDGGLPHFDIKDFAYAVHDRAKAALEGRYR